MGVSFNGQDWPLITVESRFNSGCAYQVVAGGRDSDLIRLITGYSRCNSAACHQICRAGVAGARAPLKTGRMPFDSVARHQSRGFPGEVDIGNIWPRITADEAPAETGDTLYRGVAPAGE